jgi:hypothetical protein
MRMSAWASKRKCQKLHFSLVSDRVHRRVVEEHHAPLRLALVVLVDRVDQRRRHGRRVALQDELRAVVDGRAQQRQRLLDLALAVVALQHQRRAPAGQPDAAALVDALHAQTRLRNTASPPLALPPLRPSIMASLMGGGRVWASATAAHRIAPATHFKTRENHFSLWIPLKNTAPRHRWEHAAITVKAAQCRTQVVQNPPTCFSFTDKESSCFSHLLFAPALFPRRSVLLTAISSASSTTRSSPAPQPGVQVSPGRQGQWTLTLDVPGVTREDLNIGIEGSRGAHRDPGRRQAPVQGRLRAAAGN